MNIMFTALLLLQVDEEAPSLTASCVVVLSYRTLHCLQTRMFSIQTFICKVPHEIKSDKSRTCVCTAGAENLQTLSKHVVPGLSRVFSVELNGLNLVCRRHEQL